MICTLENLIIALHRTQLSRNYLTTLLIIVRVAILINQVYRGLSCEGEVTQVNGLLGNFENIDVQNLTSFKVCKKQSHFDH